MFTYFQVADSHSHAGGTGENSKQIHIWFKKNNVSNNRKNTIKGILNCARQQTLCIKWPDWFQAGSEIETHYLSRVVKKKRDHPIIECNVDYITGNMWNLRLLFTRQSILGSICPMNNEVC